MEAEAGLARNVDQVLSGEMLFVDWVEDKKRVIPCAVLEELGENEEWIALLHFIFTLPRDQCCACDSLCDPTDHHVFPKRHFGNGGANHLLICFCKACHQELEREIIYELRSAFYYVRHLLSFIAKRRRVTVA
jgi:hypothetical protein